VHQVRRIFGHNVLRNKAVCCIELFVLTISSVLKSNLYFFAVVITAVELMLDAFDRKISDRYKMIDYREDDNQKTIIHFSSDYFTTVSIPIMLGILETITFCCFCFNF
jgi:hypothetical protein